MAVVISLERVFRDKNGFTTIGVALALLITLSLVFSAAQVYRINSVSTETQAVADAAALAAANEIAEFVIVARFCDALLLTLSLTGLVSIGLGIVSMCTPVTFELSEGFLEVGRQVIEARDRFAQQSASTLDQLQRALPVLAAANAMSVATANDASGGQYLAVSVLVPWEGESIVGADGEEIDQLLDEVDAGSKDLKDKAQRAEDVAAEANEAKLDAFNHDCGFNPGYCMYERAATLAGMRGGSNPLFSSVDAWSFSVALNRAKAYYAERIAQEAPEGSSVEEQAQSALRKRLYEYASDCLEDAYVIDVEGSFQANFPMLPKNTEEMRESGLYTQEVYPVTGGDDGGFVMHAWDGCPNAGGSSFLGSVSQMESGAYETCLACGFSAASLGKVAAASSSIENGFEYHYRAVAAAAGEYQDARQKADPLFKEVQDSASGLFSKLSEVAQAIAGDRLQVNPPGSYGVVVLVAGVGEVPLGFGSSFVGPSVDIGARTAISAATLLEEPAGEGGSVISSALDGLSDSAASATGVMGIVLDCWSRLLHAYGEGQDALKDGVSGALDAIPLKSASGLGAWAASAFDDAVEAVGLQPADLDACKPVLVNSYHVGSHDSSAFGATLLNVKQIASSYGDGSIAQLARSVGHTVLDVFWGSDGVIRIATVQIAGSNGPDIPIEIALPPSVREVANGMLDGAFDALDGMTARITGARVWE